MYEVEIESVTVLSHICHRYMRLLMVIVIFMFAADILAAILDLQHCMHMGHIRSIPCETRHTIGAKKYVSK